MLKSTNLILLTISTFSLSAQEARTLISGNIKSDEKDLKDIHIINNNSKKATLTNANGQFSIWEKNKDTLVFRGIQFEYKEIIITKTNIDTQFIQGDLTTRTNLLK